MINMAIIERQGNYGLYYGNEYNSSNSLNLNQMKVNATYIYNYLKNKGWTLNAIAGLLGNMQSESAINPGRWQSDNVGNLNLGYGLVQWTPATKYINWIGVANDPSKMDNNLSRIEYERQNNLQWISTSLYPISFNEFIVSTDTPETLASVWLKNYERAGVEVESERRENARYWFEYLGGIIPPTPIKPKIKKPFNWVLYSNKIRKRNNLKSTF